MGYLFILYLFFEVLLSVTVSSYIGALWTFIEIVVTMFLGIWIILTLKQEAFKQLQQMANNLLSMEAFAQMNLFSFLGAIFLIIPGFLTDILGLLLQFSWVSNVIVNRFSAKYDSCSQPKGEDNVIDVEIVDDAITHFESASKRE